MYWSANINPPKKNPIIHVFFFSCWHLAAIFLKPTRDLRFWPFDANAFYYTKKSAQKIIIFHNKLSRFRIYSSKTHAVVISIINKLPYNMTTQEHRYLKLCFAGKRLLTLTQAAELWQLRLESAKMSENKTRILCDNDHAFDHVFN